MTVGYKVLVRRPDFGKSLGEIFHYKINTHEILYSSGFRASNVCPENGSIIYFLHLDDNVATEYIDVTEDFYTELPVEMLEKAVLSDIDVRNLSYRFVENFMLKDTEN